VANAPSDHLLAPRRHWTPRSRFLLLALMDRLSQVVPWLRRRMMRAGSRRAISTAHPRDE
jgi:hypothetical protein